MPSQCKFCVVEQTKVKMRATWFMCCGKGKQVMVFDGAKTARTVERAIAAMHKFCQSEQGKLIVEGKWRWSPVYKFSVGPGPLPGTLCTLSTPARAVHRSLVARLNLVGYTVVAEEVADGKGRSFRAHVGPRLIQRMLSTNSRSSPFFVPM